MILRDSERISGTPQMALAIRATSELIEKGWALPIMPVNWDDRCVWAEVGGKVVGLIAWRAIEWTSTAYINLSYVIPQCRRMGIFQAMYARVMELAQAAKLSRVGGSIHVDNLAMRRAASSVGRKEYAVYSEASTNLPYPLAGLAAPSTPTETSTSPKEVKS